MVRNPVNSPCTSTPLKRGVNNQLIQVQTICSDTNRLQVPVSGEKFALIAVALVHHCWTIAFNTPAVVCQHMAIPSTLVAFFYCHRVVVKSLSLFITDSSKIVWKFVQMTEQEMHFDAHFASQNDKILRACYQLDPHNFQPFYFQGNSSWRPQKTTKLPFLYHSLLGQKLDHAQVYGSVVHQILLL